MRAVDALISEHFTDLVDSVEASNDELLEEEFRSYSQLKVLLEDFRLCREWLGESATSLRIQDRSLHLQEVPLVKVGSEEPYYLSSSLEELLEFAVHNKVEVALLKSLLSILQRFLVIPVHHGQVLGALS